MASTTLQFMYPRAHFVFGRDGLGVKGLEYGYFYSQTTLKSLKNNSGNVRPPNRNFENFDFFQRGDQGKKLKIKFFSKNFFVLKLSEYVQNL